MLMQSDKYTKPILYTLFITTSIQFCFFIVYTMFIKVRGAGDEVHFINAFILINKYGWTYAIKYGISIPYILLTYPATLIMEPYIALRIVNLTILIFFIYYLYKYLGIKQYIVYLIIIQYISITSYYLFGTNDALFSIALGIFLIEYYIYFKTGELRNPRLAFTALIIALFTRALIVFYLPVIIILLLISFRYILNLTKNGVMKIPLIVFSVLLLLNLPSLIYKHKPSYDNKPGKYNITWAQKGYLWQLKNPDSKNKNQLSWEEVKEYIDLHGENSLPRGYRDAIFFDFNLTLREFYVDFIDGLKGSFRQLGILLLLPLLFILAHRNEVKIAQIRYLNLTYLFTLLLFSFVIIVYVELRWLGSVGLMHIVCTFDHLYSGFKTKYKNLVILIVHLSFLFLSVYGIYTYSKLLLK